jgi:hypothetical protein
MYTLSILQLRHARRKELIDAVYDRVDGKHGVGNGWLSIPS